MEWSDLRIFLAIARAGTLSAAAAAIGGSQPTMGRRLRALEASVGHRLFQRTSAGFVPTDEGLAMLEHAERIEEEVLTIERRLTGRALEGPLRLTATEWFATTVLSPILAGFAAIHPGVELTVLADPQLLSLTRRDADLAFRIRPFDEPNVISRRLMHLPYAAYVQRGHPGRDTLILLEADFAGQPDDSWLPRRLPRARAAFRSNSRAVQARLCAAGAGVAILPTRLGDGLPALERVDLGEAPPGRDVWLGYHRDLRHLSRLRALVDTIVEHLHPT